MEKQQLLKKSYYLKENYPKLWLALFHHKTHKNKRLTFDKHLYLKQVYSDNSDDMCIMKSTQNGLSEYLIVYGSDELRRGRAVFYVLPTHELKLRFVSNRWEKSYMYSAFYKQLVEEAKNQGAQRKASASLSLKDVGQGVISFAGSQSEVPFTEFPADVLIIDEKDSCDQNNIEMGRERLDHSDVRRQITVGNPTITNYGIHADYKISDQKVWMNKCPHCGKWYSIDFFKHIVRQIDDSVYVLRDKEGDLNSELDIRPVCEHCGKFLDRYSNGEHVPKLTGVKKSGYQISKLYSGTARLQDLVSTFNKGLTNDFIMERFYNADLGLPYVSKGAKITREMLEEVKQNYTLPDFLPASKTSIMGVDVGGVLHVRIDEIYGSGEDRERRAVFIGTVRDLDDLFELVKRYKVKSAVIDALPETRLSKKFSLSIPGAFRCFFGSEKKDSINLKDKIVTVDRTQALDGVKENYLLKKVHLPMNADSIPDYYSQMQASTRIFDEKKNKYSWEEGSADDHYLLAEAYLDIAEKVLVMATK